MKYIDVQYVQVINNNMNEYRDHIIKATYYVVHDFDALQELTSSYLSKLEKINPSTEYAARIYHRTNRLGTFYANGEFYPSSFFDDRPNYFEQNLKD